MKNFLIILFFIPALNLAQKKKVLRAEIVRLSQDSTRLSNELNRILDMNEQLSQTITELKRLNKKMLLKNQKQEIAINSYKNELSAQSRELIAKKESLTHFKSVYENSKIILDTLRYQFREYQEFTKFIFYMLDEQNVENVVLGKMENFSSDVNSGNRYALIKPTVVGKNYFNNSTIKLYSPTPFDNSWSSSMPIEEYKKYKVEIMSLFDSDMSTIYKREKLKGKRILGLATTYVGFNLLSDFIYIDELKSEINNIEKRVGDCFEKINNPPIKNINQNVLTLTASSSNILKAEFPGGERALKDYIEGHLNYPVRCEDEGINGSVVLRFMIDQSGRVSNVSVIEETKTCPEFTNEAIRLLKQSPRWNPGQIKGRFVNSWREIPIRFSISTSPSQE